MKTFSFVRSLLALVVGCSSLLVSSSDAHAGTWSEPVYTVSNRVPTTDPNTTTPAGGGGSVAGQHVNPGGPVAGGTVEAKFTWRPAQGQTIHPSTATRHQKTC